MSNVGLTARLSLNGLFSLIVSAMGMALLSPLPPAWAEWSAIGGGTLFYTDQAYTFSAVHRSSLDGDPSQPVLEDTVVGKTKDMVFEPNLRVMKFIPSSWGQTAFTVKLRGLVYAVNPEFSQPNFHLEGVHSFNPGTAIRLRFLTTPDRFLGRTEVEHDGVTSLQDARITSYIGAVRFDKRLSEHWEVQLYGRAGIRRWNDPFIARDTTLWAIGPHVIWHMTHHARMVLGYHYERGLAEGRHTPELHDDSSYHQHFAAVALEVDLMEHLELELDFHYERVNFTTGIAEDHHHFHGYENIFIGGGRLLYQLRDDTSVTLTVQRGNRNLYSEVGPSLAYNTNVGLGILYRF